MTLTNPDRWYHALAPATAVVDCDGQAHRVTWRRGKLVLEDHDLTAERTMLVFGGRPCTCMRVMEMWRQQFGMPPEAFASMDRWLGENAYLAPPELAHTREMGMVVSWERAWRKSSWLHRKQARLLKEELRSRALRPLRGHLNHWKAAAGARMVSSVEVDVVPAYQPASMEGRVDGISMRASARLGARWVVDVWARGAAVVDGAFVLEAQASDAEHLAVRAVRWAPGADGRFAPHDAPAAAEWSDGGWHLTWEGDSHV